MGRNTRQNSFKKGVHIGLKHTRTRTKYYLKAGPHYNSKMRCSGCDNPVMEIRADHGKYSQHAKEGNRYEKPAMYCYHCQVIFPRYAVVVSLVGQYQE